MFQQAIVISLCLSYSFSLFCNENACKTGKSLPEGKDTFHADCLARFFCPWPWFKVENNSAVEIALNNEGNGRSSDIPFTTETNNIDQSGSVI